MERGHVLEQMTIWREYYNETVVPQGTVYDYEWGMVASNRDQAQHALLGFWIAALFFASARMLRALRAQSWYVAGACLTAASLLMMWKAQPADYKAATITVYAGPSRESRLTVPVMNGCEEPDCTN